MTNTITGKIDALMEQVAGACGDLVEHVTIDETEVKPPRGKVCVWVKPPEVAWPYAGAENELSVRLVFVAGSPWAQASALPLLLAAMDRLAACHIGRARRLHAWRRDARGLPDHTQ